MRIGVICASSWTVCLLCPVTFARLSLDLWVVSGPQHRVICETCDLAGNLAKKIRFGLKLSNFLNYAESYGPDHSSHEAQ